MEKERTLLSVALALIGYVFLIQGRWQLIIIITIGFISILALLILLKDKFPSRIESFFIKLSQGLDLSLLAFGLASFGAGIVFLNNIQYSILILFEAVIFLLCGAYLIGGSFGLYSLKLRSYPLASLILGIVSLMVCVIYTAFSWNSILEEPKNNSVIPFLFLGYSIILFYAAFRGRRKIS